MKHNKNLLSLAIPLIIETFFMMFVAFADTAMLAFVSDEAVGAVGTANSLLSLVILAFSLVAVGALTVMTQYIGAGQQDNALKVGRIGMRINLVLGLILSIFMFFFTDDLLDLMGVTATLRHDAIAYLTILGSTVILFSPIPILAQQSRAFGHTKGPMYGTILANIVNIIFNALFIFNVGGIATFVYDLFGFEHTPVVGVALATVLSRITNFTVNWVYAHGNVPKPLGQDTLPGLILVKKTLLIGIPSVVENMTYSVAMVFVVSFLNQMGDATVIARSYVQQIATFSFATSMGLSAATNIMVGWYVGDGQFDLAYKRGISSLYITIGFSTGMAFLIALLAPYLVGIFTQDPTIIQIAVTVLWVDVILEVGRALNITAGGALKSTGDATYTLIIAVIFMSLFQVGFGYLFGIVFQWGLVGIWLASTLDELVRGTANVLRWRSRIWQTKVLVRKSERLL